jgi:tetratricopeptide (TPR) repeat protein
MDPNASEALYNLSRVLQRTDPDKAKIYRDRFTAMQRSNQLTTQAQTVGNFALASANRGDYAQAISQFHEALEECGDCQWKADLYKDLGLIECKSGDVGHGEKDLLQARSLKPQDPDIQKALQIVAYARTERPTR